MLVRRRRAAVGLTQQEPAARAGVSVGAVRDLEPGRVNPPAPRILKHLAVTLGLPRGTSATRPAARAGHQAHATAPGYESGVNLEDACRGRDRAGQEDLEFAPSDEDPGETPNGRKVTSDIRSSREVAIQHVVSCGVGEAVKQPYRLARHFRAPYGTT